MRWSIAFALTIATADASPMKAGEKWTLACKTDGTEVAGDLVCSIDKVRSVGKTRLSHVTCNKVGELDPSMWLAEMPGGTWGFHDQRRFWSEHHGLTPDHAIAAADLTAIAKQHALVDAKPHRETWLEPYTNDEKYSGINFLHEQHDELWCEAQFPYGLGGGHHDYVECFDARGQLRGVELAEDNDGHPHATACGSLASMPNWIENR